jgi:hypothetical protein
MILTRGKEVLGEKDCSTDSSAIKNPILTGLASNLGFRNERPAIKRLSLSYDGI